MQFISIIVMVIAETILATLVVSRTGWSRRAGWFVGLVLCMGTSNLTSQLRPLTSDATSRALINNVSMISIGCMQLALLGLLSILFMPAWWSGRRPIRLILAPYVLAIALIVLDLLAGLQLFVADAAAGHGLARQYVQPSARILLMSFVAGWLVHLGLLIAAFRSQRQARPLIGLLLAAIGFSIIAGLLTVQLGLEGIVSTFALTIPILTALGYAVLRTRLIVPVRVALDQALRTLREAVLVLDRAGSVIYANRAAAELGAQVQQPPPRELAAEAQEATIAGRQLVVDRSIVYGRSGELQYRVLLVRDITEINVRTAQIELERARLAATVQQLHAERSERAQLAATVEHLTQPLIPVLADVLVLPLIGELDARRRESLMYTLLHGIEHSRAQCVLIDLTGLTLLDADGGRALVRATAAARLLGARCVLIGIRPELAQTLVALGEPLGAIETAATLQQAVQAELQRRAQPLDHANVRHTGVAAEMLAQ